MQAIQLKYLPATDHQPSRLKAWINGGTSYTQPLQYSLDDHGASECVYNLALKLGWNCKFVGGTLPNGNMAFVIVESNTTLEVK